MSFLAARTMTSWRRPLIARMTAVVGQSTTRSLSLSSSKDSLNPKQQGFFARMWEQHSVFGEQRRLSLAEDLFQSAFKQADDARWFGPGRIPRDFRNRHAIISMHIWFLHKRLLQTSDEYAHYKTSALQIQEGLFDILWEDTISRIRNAGVYELAVHSHLKKVENYTYSHLCHYDHAFSLENDNQIFLELRRVIWMHVLLRNDEAYHDHVDRLAFYVMAQHDNIMNDLPLEYFMDGRIGWVDLPDFSKLKDNHDQILNDEPPLHPDDVLPGSWRRNITLQGEYYYWNPDMMVSSWERPSVAGEDRDPSSYS